MKYDEAYYLLNEVFEEIKKICPEIRMDRYRDGGSIDFNIPPVEKYREIVLIAPCSMVYNKEHTKVEYKEINHADIMVPGCTKFEDIYKKENAIKVVSLDDRFRWQFDKEQVKAEIINELKKRLKLC
jgi:hypothetical protein